MKYFMQYLAVFASTIIMISYGMAFGWPSPALPKLFASDSQIKITKSEGSWISVMPFVGALFGAPFAAFFADKFGRKLFILLSAFPLLISWLLLALVENITGIFIARILCGVTGGGLFTVIPSYLSEITSPNIRGRLSIMLPFTWNLGVFISFVAGPFLTIKLMALIACVLPILFLLVFIWMPESPYYYAMKNRPVDGKKVLQIFRGDENVDECFQDIINYVEKQNYKSSVWDIFQKATNRKILILILCLLGIQEFSGRSPFIFYSQIIFNEVDSHIDAIYITMIYGFVQLISTLSTTLFIDKFGRKPLLIISCAGTSVCLLLEGIYFYLKTYSDYDLNPIKWLPVSAMFGFVVSFNIGLGPVPMIMASETFSTTIKSSGLCIVDIYVAVISIFISKFFQIISDEIGFFVPFWFFSGVCFIGIFFVKIFLPETKGISLEEIQKMLEIR